jgi:hypothetical protein
MPEMQGEKGHLPGTRKMLDAPGASPRRYGAPVAKMFYYLNRDFR